MKLLFDQNLSFKLCGALSDLFPGSSQARLLGLADADDRAIWERAKAEGFVLVSRDSDFAEMAALRGSPPKVLWLRLGNAPTGAVERALRRHRLAIEEFGHDPDASCLELY
jgi:predicted nuclease of predicted toxin-antitoxin system